MTEEPKYFTPKIEDIRVNYEMEVFIGDKWIPFSFSKDDCIESIHSKIDNSIPFIKDIEAGIVRVPYLTQEQICAEGWNDEGKKGNYSLDWGTIIREGHEPFVFVGIVRDGNPQYTGECKDINTLRYISKLLGI